MQQFLLKELNLQPLVVFANDGPPPNVLTLSEEGYRMLLLGSCSLNVAH